MPRNETETSVCRILLPVGWQGLFYLTDPPKVGERSRFWFDHNALSVVTHELIAEGVASLITSCETDLNDVELGLHLSKRIKLVDKRGSIRSGALAVIRPIAVALKIAPSFLDIVTDPIVGPQRHIIKLSSDEQKALFAHLLVALNFTYQFELGMRYRAQIDVPLGAIQNSLGVLRDNTRESASTANLAFLSGILSTYEMQAVGSLRLAASIASDAQVINFREFVEDEVYRQYTAARHNLGFRTRVTAAVDRSWELSRRVLSTSRFQALLAYAAKLVFTSVRVPEPVGSVGGFLSRSEYMPPIVNLSAPITRAHNRWAASNSDARPIKFTYASAPDFAARLLAHTQLATIVADAKWFLGLFEFRNSDELRGNDPAAQQEFMQYFAVNLKPPYVCPKHLQEVGIDEIAVDWGADEFRFAVQACCEDAAKASWAQMCAHDPQKSY